VVVGALPAAADSGTLTMRGSLGVEVRTFTMRPAYALQDRDPVQGSFVASAKASWASAGNDVVIDVAPFLRLDTIDDERTHWDMREAAVNVYSDHLDVRLGVSKVYWGVTESRKLVDIVNQTDLVEDPDGDEKLGQPMLMLRGHVTDFEAAVLVLPAFRPRTFSGPEGRLRPGVPIDEDKALYESGERTGRVDIAGRLKGRIDDVDIGLSYFSGTSREPRFVFDGMALVPVYHARRPPSSWRPPLLRGRAWLGAYILAGGRDELGRRRRPRVQLGRQTSLRAAYDLRQGFLRRGPVCVQRRRRQFGVARCPCRC
jgi:hypothetical protein